MSRHKELAKNTLIIFLGKISTQFLSFFLLPIYTNYLTTADYGTIDLILTYITLLVPTITLQQEMSTFRFLIDSRDNREETSKIITSSIQNTLMYLLIFSIIYVILIQFICIKYQFFIYINIFACIFSNLFLQIARGLGNNLKYSVATFLTGIITLTSNIILIVFLHFGAYAMLLSMTLANFICIIYLTLSLKLYNYITFNYSDTILKKKMLAYSAPLVPNGISWWLINVSDRTIVSIFLGTAANGIYAISNKFPSIISSFISIFSLSWSESASLHINDSDCDAFFSNITEMILKVFSCLCICLLSILPIIYKYIIGYDFLDSYNYIPIFMVGCIANSIVNVYSGIYIAKKLTKKVAATSLMAAIINATINILFIKNFKLYAAAFSTALAYIFMMFYRYFDIKKYVNIKINKRIIAMIILAFSLTCFVYYKNLVCLNYICFACAILFSIFLNKNTICSFFKLFNQKIRRGNV